MHACIPTIDNRGAEPVPDSEAMATADRGKHGGRWKRHQAGRPKRSSDRVAVAVRRTERRRTGSAPAVLRGGGRNAQRIHFPRSGRQSLRVERRPGERRVEPRLFPGQDRRRGRPDGREQRLAPDELRHRCAKHHADAGGAGRIRVLPERVGTSSRGDSGVRNLDLEPVLKAVFRSQGPPDSAGFHFSPDGKSIAFVIEEAGIDNIWMQPVDGSKGRKLTNFNDSERIQDFRWSPDGKALAMLRFSSVSDVILLRDTGNSSRVAP